MADEYTANDDRPGIPWVLAGIVLYILDFVYKFKGIDFNSFINILTRFDKAVYFNGLIIIIMAAHLVFAKYKGESQKEILMEIFSYYCLALLISIIFSMGGLKWMGAMFHIMFAAAFLWLVLYKSDIASRSQANFIILGLLLVDFFLFSVIHLNKLLIPVWFFAALIYTKPSKLKSWLVFIIILFYLFHFAGSIMMYGGKQEMINGKDISDLTNFGSTSWNNFKDFGKGLWSTAEKQKNITQAMVFGDYYTSQVDDNVQQPLGVSIIEVKSTDPYVYEDEPFIMYARLQARTLKDEITIKNFCHADSVLPNAIIPQEETITQYEDLTIDCMFNECRFSPGSKTIYFNINFNFQTMSYLRNYFIDRERLRTMISEDPSIYSQQDILTKYGISDTEPIALSTNGPMRIGMEVEKTQPVSIDRNRDSMSFRLGITLENNWEGKIKNVKNLTIILPKEMNLELDGGTKGTYCGGFNFEPKTCANIFGQDAGDWCDDATSNIYTINQEGKNQKIIPVGQPGIDRYKTLICRMSLTNYNSFLGLAPIAIKNFKVISDYDYELQKSNSINIRASQYKGCKAEQTSEEIAEMECKGFMVDKSNLPPSDHQERYKRYQNTIKTLTISYRPRALNEIKTEALIAAIMSDVSQMGEVDKNENGIEDFVAGFGMNFPNVFIDSPNQNIEKAMMFLKKYIDESSVISEDEKIKYALIKYKENNGLEDVMDKSRVMDYYEQWQNMLCKGEKKPAINGEEPPGDSVPFATIFKKNDLIGVDSNGDGYWTKDDDYYFIRGFKKGADGSWVYMLNASKIPLLEQMKLDAFDYQRNLDSGSMRIMIQRPATQPNPWDTVIFVPNKELKNGAVI